MKQVTLPPVQPSKWDNLFKAVITAGWCVKSDGNVESPSGYFSITEIPSNFNEYNDLVDAVDPDGDFEWDDLDGGWYFTRENSDGLIFVYAVDKQAAEVLYEAAEADYVEWLLGPSDPWFGAAKN